MKALAAAFVTTFVILAAGSAAWATPAQVLIIRHGEKPDTGYGLSAAGQARAQALVGYFETNPDVTRFGTPVAIYAMTPDENDTEAGTRPLDTVTPLANALGLTVLDTYAKDDVQSLATEVLSNPAYEGKMVLICWEHKMITPLASDLGVSDPGKYPKNDFGQVWEIDFYNDQVVDFRQYEEDLNLSSTVPH